jgi:putative acetyltransferase
MRRGIVRRSYRSSSPEPLKVRESESLSAGDRQSEWPGWVWCVNERGQGGWVPRSYLEEAGDRWRIRVDYDATELTVDEGDTLDIVGEESGWVLCTDRRNQRGWVPSSHFAVAGPDAPGAADLTTPSDRPKRVEIDIVEAQEQDVESVRGLFREYADALGFDLCFQDFEQELATLPGRYLHPDGVLILALAADAAVGCVALRRLGPDTCELKRLYVRLAHRGSGLGRRLVAAAIFHARELGYHRMRLDTVPSMNEAIALYRSFGFIETAPYRHNPVQGAVFMELEL